MKPIYAGALTLALAAVFGAVFVLSPQTVRETVTVSSEMAGADVVPFSAEDTDGTKHTLAELTKDGPVVLYLISIDCPVNSEAAPYYQRIAAAYGEKAKFVGVAVGSTRQANDWKQRFQADFPVLADPNGDIVSGLGAYYSPWAVLTDGKKVLKVWEGSSQRNLKEINQEVAKASNLEPKQLAFNGVPEGGG